MRSIRRVSLSPPPPPRAKLHPSPGSEGERAGPSATRVRDFGCCGMRRVTYAKAHGGPGWRRVRPAGNRRLTERPGRAQHKTASAGGGATARAAAKTPNQGPGRDNRETGRHRATTRKKPNGRDAVSGPSIFHIRAAPRPPVPTVAQILARGPSRLPAARRRTPQVRPSRRANAFAAAA